jgi:diguanylate cyclase (GGDEF)-like protein
LRLDYLAKHDPLTHLLNRTEFQHRLQNALDVSNKHRVEHTLLFIDLDQFKIVNDTCGHIAGDELLCQISILFRKHLRARDSLARLGGDEFGVLLERCPLEKGVDIAELLRLEIDDFRFAWNGHGFSLGASIGVVRVSVQSDSVVKLLSHADTACYTAKDTGRNRVVVYREQEHAFIQRQTQIQMIATVRDAIDSNQLLLYCQPIVPMTRSSLSGRHFEILVRMLGPDGVVLPGAFLPAAERYNLMPKLDRWVVRSTLAWLAGAAPAADARLACINLSGQTVSDKGFLGFVQNALSEYGVDPTTVAFEITENHAIANLGDTINLMQTLKKDGVCFGLDDFGSGFSSYAYLRHLPVDFIKIDGGFVRHVAANAVDRAVVKSITDIGHAMDLSVVAEFVENAKILYALKALNVDFAQGFYYSQGAFPFSGSE